MGEKYVWIDNGMLAHLVTLKRKIYYERLLSVENEQERGSLLHVNPAEGSAKLVDSNMIDQAIKDMKTGKTPGPSRVTAGRLKISGKEGCGLVTHIVIRVSISSFQG